MWNSWLMVWLLRKMTQKRRAAGDEVHSIASMRRGVTLRAILCTLLKNERWVIVHGVLWWPWNAAITVPNTGVLPLP